MIKKKKIGIYGGTFNPPHKGHVRAAHAFLESCSLDRLLVMPANIPPHKIVRNDNPQIRHDMTELAFSDSPYYKKKLFVSDYELKEKRTSYTVKTLRRFSSPFRELYLLCGTDMFLSLPTWYRPEEIFRRAVIVLARRESDPEEAGRIEEAKERFIKAYGGKIVEIDYDPIEVSSTEIREAVKEGKDLKALVPDAVEDYIVKNGLYKEANDDRKS